jgi:transcriptional repressor NrdR
MVMNHLRELDHIAYIRFASVYRAFADLEELQDELEALAARGVAPGPEAGQPTLIPDDELKELTRGVRSLPIRRRRRSSKTKSQAAGQASRQTQGKGS